MKNRRTPEKLGVNPIITHYGYSDGSGEYYIAIDAEKCNGCGKCLKLCPQKALELTTIMIDLEEKAVAGVTEEHRRRIKYTCSPCKPDNGRTPCMLVCKQKAITCTWNPEE